MVAYSGGNRRQNRDWRAKAGVSLVAGLAVGAAIGMALGYLGWLWGGQVRGLVLALGAVIVLLFSAFPRLPLPQWNHETPQQLLEWGGLSWAASNGALLGAGVASRIEFALWYLVPAVAFAAGSPWSGAVVYGGYSLIRLSAIVALAAAARRTGHPVAAEATIRLSRQARWVARSVGVGLGILGVAVGLA